MTELDRIIELLKRLPPDRQQIVSAVVDRFSKDAGVDVTANCALPADNIGRWE